MSKHNNTAKIVNMPKTKIDKSEFENYHNKEKKATKSTSKKEELKFPINAFPKKIQQIIQSLNEVYQIPIDYYGGGILTVASSAIGRGYNLKYKSYTVPINLFTALVGGVSVGKTPVVDFCVEPLEKTDKSNYKRYREKLKKWKEDENGDKPICENLLLSDVTTEAVSKALKTTKNGILIVRDELVGWLKGMNQYKNKGGDEEYWLTAWNGGNLKINRTSTDDEVTYVFNIRISILGGLQPSVLVNFFGGSKKDNGFLARILFVYPSVSLKPKESGIEPNETIFSDYQKIIDKLYQCSKLLDDDKPQDIEMTLDAIDAYRKWKNKNTDEINYDIDNQAIKGIYSKMELYCLRFALILELLDAVCNDKHINPMSIKISKKQIDNAILISEYFKKTAERVFDRVYNHNPLSELSEEKRQLYNSLPNTVTRKEAIEQANKLKLGISDKTVYRFLKQNPKLFKWIAHGKYNKQITNN